MKPYISRRRFLSISAAAAVLPTASRASDEAFRWRGVALGADATIIISGIDGPAAAAVVSAVEAELDRLERLFSLYRTDSQLMGLNRDGHLNAPAAEMIEILQLAGAIHDATDGAFDPTVQRLWLLQARAAALGVQLPERDLATALDSVGWRHVRLSEDAVAFNRKDMAITLNGIAQGYIADRIAALLRAWGLTDVLVNTGEIVALGQRPDGTPWRAGIARPSGAIVRECILSDRGLATSAPAATTLDDAGRIGHIFDPRSGRPASTRRLVSVSARSAAVADGLSTAICLLSSAEIDAALARFPDAALEALT